MNLRNVDLNLLVVLDALLEERNVSRAGRRIGLSQPAMSAALGRLRELFRDPLLVRAGRNLALTEGAEELIVPVRDILTRVEQAIEERPKFDPRRDERAFSISASDYATLVLIVPLVRALVAEAPGVTIHLLPRFRDVGQVLKSDQADIVIEPRELFSGSKFPSQIVFTDRWLCVTDVNNPQIRRGRLTMDSYLRLPHLVYGIGNDRQLNLADQHLRKTGVHRRIEVTVESFLLVPFLLEGTEMVSLILERAAQRLSGLTSVRTFRPPVELPEIYEAMYWHPRHTADPGHRWLRDRLQAIADGLEGR